MVQRTLQRQIMRVQQFQGARLRHFLAEIGLAGVGRHSGNDPDGNPTSPVGNGAKAAKPQSLSALPQHVKRKQRHQNDADLRRFNPRLKPIKAETNPVPQSCNAPSVVAKPKPWIRPKVR